jgi:cobalt-zinc-cadmium efflux system membrane fusion protein
MKKITALWMVFFALCDAKLIEMTQKQKEDLGIDVAMPTLVEFMQYGPFNGRIVKEHKDIEALSFAYEGIVEEIYVKKNQPIEAGDKLLALASQELLALQSEYLNALEALEQAQKNLQRDEKLLEGGIISQKRFLESQKEEKRCANTVALLRERLYVGGLDTQALSELKQTRLPKKQVTLYAPFAGVVEEIHVVKGEKAIQAQKLITFVHHGALYVTFEVPLEVAAHISYGDVCSLGPNEASIVSVAKSVSLNSQSVEVRALLNSRDYRVNQIVALRVRKSIPSGYRVKKSAVVFYQNKPYIFVAKKEGFESVAVVIVNESQEHYTIDAPIYPHDAIATKATSALLGAMEGEDE